MNVPAWDGVISSSSSSRSSRSPSLPNTSSSRAAAPSEPDESESESESERLRDSWAVVGAGTRGRANRSSPSGAVPLPEGAGQAELEPGPPEGAGRMEEPEPPEGVGRTTELELGRLETAGRAEDFELVEDVALEAPVEDTTRAVVVPAADTDREEVPLPPAVDAGG